MKMGLSHRFLAFSTILLWFPAIAVGQRAPHAMTEAERLLYRSYHSPAAASTLLQPPAVPVRAMAEWEEVQAVVLSWAFYPTVPYEIVRHAQQECMVVIVCLDSVEVIDSLIAAGIPLSNVRFIITEYNSEWCRDYGPVSVYSGGADSLRFVDWIYNRPRPQDDSLSATLARWFNVPLYQTLEDPYRLVCAGGNFMTDGHGTGFSSKLVLDENPENTEAGIDSIMSAFLGIDRYVLMDDLMYDEIHHIDMHMKLLDEETLLVGEYPSGEADGPWIELNLTTVTSSTLTCYGRPYRVVRIPMPPEVDGTFPPSSLYYTYTNSVILNRTVLVPVYGFAQDSVALAIYRQAMPGYRVIGIPCNELIPGGGAIHCITREIGVSEPVWISHAPVGLRDADDTSLVVSATVRSRTGIREVSCYWTADTARGFQEVPMTGSADVFTAVLSSLPRDSSLYYYIAARSNSGRAVTRPLTAPAGFYTITPQHLTHASPDAGMPASLSLSQNFPNPFNPKTLIEYSIPPAPDRSAGERRVELAVYDLLGRRVALLVDGRQVPGRHRVVFDGRGFSSGVYICRLSVEREVRVTRMVLAK